MAVSICARVFPSFQCRSDPDFAGSLPKSEIPPISGSARFSNKGSFVGRRLTLSCLQSSLILRFPPNFVRQLSTKARRNCSNIGVAQVVAASWSNDNLPDPAAAKAVDAAAAAPVVVPTGGEANPVVVSVDDGNVQPVEVPGEASPLVKSGLGVEASHVVKSGLGVEASHVVKSGGVDDGLDGNVQLVEVPTGGEANPVVKSGGVDDGNGQPVETIHVVKSGGVDYGDVQPVEVPTGDEASPVVKSGGVGDGDGQPIEVTAGGEANPMNKGGGVDNDNAIEAPVEKSGGVDDENVELDDLDASKYSSFLKSDGSIAIHAGERLGRGIVTDAITTPVVNTSAYFFDKTSQLIDFKEKRMLSFEYGRYGNPTTAVVEKKISALEGAETTLMLASGMCASTVLLMALVPAGGHIVTTTDCYRKTRVFIETVLPKMGITATVIDPADIGALEAVLKQREVHLFFTESPTNPFLRCVDIELVSKLCHERGTLVCIDGTFATPLNQKALALGADIVIHSATKYIAGHNDVIAGCISGSDKVISVIRTLHHIMGGALNPNAAYLIIRGLKTLHLRIQQQNSTASRMAEILEGHPKVRRVYYPGLASHPEHTLAKKQMTGFGGVVSFEVDGDLLTTAKFIDTLKIPYIAPSFGGCESIVDQPAIMSYWDLCQADRAKYGILDNLVRFSFGVEVFEDIKNDILQALEAI